MTGERRQNGDEERKEDEDEGKDDGPSCPPSIESTPHLQSNELEKTYMEEEVKKSIDSFIHLGRYAFRVLVFCEFLLIGSAGNFTLMIFGGASPKSVACLDEAGILVHSDMCSLPVDDRRALNCSSYDPAYEFESVNVQFEYYCEDTQWVKGTISIEMFGVLIGSVLFGQLSDAYGRKQMLLFTTVAVFVLSLVSSFAWNLLWFTIFRTTLGLFSGGQMCVYTVYRTEHVPTRHRFLISNLIAWSPNFIFLNIVAYFCHDWRTYQRMLIVLSLPSLILLPFVFESPRWLIQRGKIKEARIVLSKSLDIDKAKEKEKVEMEEMIEQEQKNYEARILIKKQRKYTVKDLFSTREMGWHITILSTGVFTNALINYALMFNLETLAGSLFLNAVYYGLIRWFLNTGSGILDYRYKWVNRKRLHNIAQFVVGVSLIAVAVMFMLGKGVEWAVPIQIATLTAAGFCSQVDMSKDVTTVELFPTVIRNTALSFKYIWTRLGNSLAPVFWLLLPWRWAPFLILGVLSLVDSVLFLLYIPETKGRPLPEKMPEPKKNKVAPSNDCQ